MFSQQGLLKTLFLIVLLFPAWAAAGDSQSLFLGIVEVAPIAGAPEGRLEIRLFHKDGRRLAAFLSQERSYAIIEKNDYVSVMSRAYSVPRKIGAGTIAPSFVNNYNHQVFTKLKQEIMGKYGKRPPPANLIDYVNKYIDKKDYRRGFDVASRIAETREGDCTEHAILLVSLMRMFDIPAKMVLGIKIFKDDDKYVSFGHAWVEYIHEGRWKAADPALVLEVDGSYIPVGVLEDEGLDFGMDLILMLQNMPYRVEISGMRTL